MDPITILIIVVVALFIICTFAWYRIVDPSQAHLVVTPRSKFVVSSDPKVGTTKTYFAIPSWLPFVGRAIRKMDVTIKELVVNQETYEKNQARYNVKSSTKYRIVNVGVAAETFVNGQELQEQLKEVIRASVRAVTVKYDVVEARAKKQVMGTEIQKEMQDDLNKWGLALINFQLVDFADTDTSKIISDISKRREVEIETETREMNAEKFKVAKIKEADADEKAKEREIKRDEVVGMKQENQKQKIAEQQKIAEEKRFEVVKVQTVKQAEITKAEAEVKAEQDKVVAIIKANQDKESETILKEKKRLEGEGDKLRAIEQAIGEASPIEKMGEAEGKAILAKGLAEAETKDALQKALNQFGDEAIRALVAEKIVAMQEAVGIAGAKALENADMRIFAGSDDGNGFDIGKAIAATQVGNENAGFAALNKIARPNDMGMVALGLKSVQETETPKAKTTKTETTTPREAVNEEPVEEDKPVRRAKKRTN